MFYQLVTEADLERVVAAQPRADLRRVPLEVLGRWAGHRFVQAYPGVNARPAPVLFQRNSEVVRQDVFCEGPPPCFGIALGRIQPVAYQVLDRPFVLPLSEVVHPTDDKRIRRHPAQLVHLVPGMDQHDRRLDVADGPKQISLVIADLKAVQIEPKFVGHCYLIPWSGVGDSRPKLCGAVLPFKISSRLSGIH